MLSLSRSHCLYLNKQVATVLIAKGHIAAATLQITLAFTGYSVYFTMGWEMHPKLPVRLEDSGPT